MAAALLREQIERHLRREDGAAQVHQDQDAVLRPHVVDRPHHEGRVGPERPSRLIQPAGDPDPEVVAAHLRRQFRHPLGEPGAVADEDESDHARVSAAVAIRSHEEVAPGSW